MIKIYESIYSKDLPCWYELSWDKKTGSILLKFHNKGLGQIVKLNPLYVEAMQKKFAFKKFSLNPSGNIGFEDSLEKIGEEGEFLIFSLSTKGGFLSEEECFSCKGSGQNSVGNICPICQGKGKRTQVDWLRNLARSASLNIICQGLESAVKTSSSFKQLLTLSLKTERGENGGSMSGYFSPTLIRYCKEHSDSNGPVGLQYVSQVMQKAHENFAQISHLYTLRDYVAKIRDSSGFFSLSVPGDRTGIHTEEISIANTGCMLYYHNIDNSVQQLTLLAGLAALHDLVRQWEKIKA